MRTNLLRAFAVTIGLGVCTVAQAQTSYSSPAKWNNFRPVSDKAVAKEAAKDVAAAADEATKHLPAPVTEPMPLHSSMQSAPMMEVHNSAPIGSSCAPCQSAPSAYSQAASAPWSGSQMASCGSSRPALNRWFGSANLLFLTLEEGRGNRIATGTGLGSDFNTSLVDPDASTGFDIMAGRYLDCNQFGLGIGYFLWNPGAEQVVRNGTVGTIRANNVGYNDISVDAGVGVEPIYDIVNGSGGYAGATGVRVTRDLRFQGIEANLFSFGLMGAQRVARSGCNHSLLGKHGLQGGFGGASGPLRRPATGRVRVMTSHGFRWMQIEDSLELAYNVDGAAGYAANDIYDNVDIENNLFGYQFGGRLTYCLSSRMNLNIGGKFGIYGNNVEMRHRLGTETTAAYITTAGVDDIDTESSDTVLATLGELDMGLGYRLNNAWTVRGGYRLMGITGVANAVDSVPSDYSSLAASGQVDANDSYILHGGYVGLEFNW
ncbi:MAG: BBP7 family outer membrane beta-barrel protein [Rubripirellula sp.]